MTGNSFSTLAHHRLQDPDADLRCTGSLLMVALLFLSAVLAAPVSAADLRVRVFERGGQAPLTGVSVCVGTQANPTQFGAVRSDHDGYAVFRDLPRAPLTVIASKPGYLGQQESLVTSNMERLLVVSLPTGGGGPKCEQDPSGTAGRSSALQLGSFKINSGAAITASRYVFLNHALEGHPTEYRASESPDFNGARWQAYIPEPAFELSPGTGRKVVYFQVRRYSKMNGADIQTLSPVVRDSINLRLP
jgi:hypothetical protein